MEKNLDLLLSILPFEKKSFEKSSLHVEYIGHPLTSVILPKEGRVRKTLGLFPGSRSKEIERNLPLQLKIAKELKRRDPQLEIAISISHEDKREKIKKIVQGEEVKYFSPEKNYEMMKMSYLALATSGTATLELSLHQTPTVVNFAIQKLDVFIAQKIFSIHLPFYCLVNLIAGREIFPELFGPNLTEKNLYFQAEKLWFDREAREKCIQGCKEVRKKLGSSDAIENAAHLILGVKKNSTHPH